MNLVTGAGHSLFLGNGLLPRGRPLQTSLLSGCVCYSAHQSVSTGRGGPRGVLQFPHMNAGSFLAESDLQLNTVSILRPQYKTVQ